MLLILFNNALHSVFFVVDIFVQLQNSQLIYVVSLKRHS